MSTGDLSLIAMLARGYTTSLAARELYLSRHTVGERISLLLERFNCKNRAELVAYSYVHGFLSAQVWPPCGSWCARHWEGERDRDAPSSCPQCRGDVECEWDNVASQPVGRRWVAMSFDAIETLRTAGQPVDLMTAGQREVLAALTEREVQVLLDVQRRLREVEPAVEGQELKLL
jgi:DNA-binding CsgD family transcriptional regulator